MRKDSLFNRDMASQINELSTLYGVDKLRLERKRLRLQVAVAVGGCVSLLVLLALYISYSRRLRRKDEALYRSIRQEEQARHEALEAVRQLPPERSPRSMQLFLRLEKLVRDEQLYLRPEVNREYLADRLATNPTYLAGPCGRMRARASANTWPACAWNTPPACWWTTPCCRWKPLPRRRGSSRVPRSSAPSATVSACRPASTATPRCGWAARQASRDFFLLMRHRHFFRTDAGKFPYLWNFCRVGV